jgi:hypothetical protein
MIPPDDTSTDGTVVTPDQAYDMMLSELSIEVAEKVLGWERVPVEQKKGGMAMPWWQKCNWRKGGMRVDRVESYASDWNATWELITKICRQQIGPDLAYVRFYFDVEESRWYSAVFTVVTEAGNAVENYEAHSEADPRIAICNAALKLAEGEWWSCPR